MTETTTITTTRQSGRSPVVLISAFLLFHVLYLPAIVIMTSIFWGLFLSGGGDGVKSTDLEGNIGGGDSGTTLSIFTNNKKVWIGILIVSYYTYIWFIHPSHLHTGISIDQQQQRFRRIYLPWIFTPLRRFLNLTLVAHPALLSSRQSKQSTATKTAQPAPPVNTRGTEKESPQPTTTTTQHHEQYILAVFPHGVQADFRILADGVLDQVFPTTTANNIRTLAASVLFQIPFVREMVLLTGGVDASRKTAETCLQQGLSLQIVVGGQAEQIQTQAGQELVYVRKRLGFLKLALKYRVPIVPVYIFGNNDHYATNSSPLLLKLRQWLLQNLGISATFLGQQGGYWGSPCCPRPVDTTLVFGKPIRLDSSASASATEGETTSPAEMTKSSPSPEQVQEFQTKFIQALQELFDEYKTKFGNGDRTLKII